jgi:hypothetical protein
MEKTAGLFIIWRKQDCFFLPITFEAARYGFMVSFDDSWVSIYGTSMRMYNFSVRLRDFRLRLGDSSGRCHS